MMLAACGGGGGGGGGGGESFPPYPKVQAAKATDPTSIGEANLGYSVAALEEMIVAGAPYDDGTALNAGAAYIFAPSVSGALGTWRITSRLVAQDTAEEDQFGYSVGLCATYAAVGARGQDEAAGDAGAVYIFASGTTDPLGTWVQRAKLMPSDAVGGERLGESVAAHGRFVLAGAPGSGGETGASYLFATATFGSLGTWVEVGKLAAADGQALDSMGTSAALGSGIAAIGAPGSDAIAENAGAAYIFAPLSDDPLGTWIQKARLTAADADPQDNLGISIALDGETLVAGASWDDERGQDAGAVYVFAPQSPGRLGTWTQVAKLMAADAATGDFFGCSVAIDGKVIAVGARMNDLDRASPVTNAGAVYVFALHGGTWVQAAKVSASDAETWDRLGRSVALSGTLLVGGAPYEAEMGANAGAVYLFEP